MTNNTWVPPGHFYSPIVDPSDRHVRAVLEQHSSAKLPPDCGIELDDHEILQRLERISSFYEELPFSTIPTAGLRYYYENGAYGHGDGATYFCMMRDLRPKRIIEIGSGYSSCLAIDVNERFFNRAISLQFIDPNPELLLSLLDGDDFYSERVVRSKVQDIPTDVFRQLEANDILFIDSSHVGKLASDVNDYFIRILPALKPGVVIHIHDVPYPFEYSSDWIDKENRSWNEAYMLRSFLQYNTTFKVIYFNHYAYRKHERRLRERMPLCMVNCGASIWLQRRLV